MLSAVVGIVVSVILLLFILKPFLDELDKVSEERDRYKQQLKQIKQENERLKQKITP